MTSTTARTCLPTALSVMTGYAPSDRGGSAVTRTMPGYHVGAVLTALLALVLVDRVGWPGDSDVVKGRFLAISLALWGRPSWGCCWLTG